MTDPPQHLRRRRHLHLGRSLLLAGMFLAPLVRADSPEEEKIRIGFSYSMFYGVNENDAKASIRGMAADFSQQHHFDAEPEPHLYDGVTAIIAGVRQHEVNYLGLTTEEYAALRYELEFERFAVGVNNGEQTLRYVLLVHRLAGVDSLAALKGRTLSLMSGPRMSLATLWLDVELAKQGRPATAEFFGPVTPYAKPGKAILSVFFRQADACLVTRHMFQTIAELNPQIQRDLQIVATSPPYIASFFAFVAGLPPALLDRSIREFSNMHRNPSGQQLLTIFQTDLIRELPFDNLASSLSLVDEHARLCPAASRLRRAALHVPEKTQETRR